MRRFHAAYHPLGAPGSGPVFPPYAASCPVGWGVTAVENPGWPVYMQGGLAAELGEPPEADADAGDAGTVG